MCVLVLGVGYGVYGTSTLRLQTLMTESVDEYAHIAEGLQAVSLTSMTILLTFLIMMCLLRVKDAVYPR